VDFVFEAELWLWDARKGDSWTFLSLPVDAAAEIRDRTAGMANGFGSLRVTATIGSSTWQTSIFPDAAHDSYALPVRKAVQKKERIAAGDSTEVTVELRDF
jgi:hypothetical protein